MKPEYKYVNPTTGMLNLICVDCGGKCSMGCTRCRKCAGKRQSLTRLGVNNPVYKHGKTSHNTCECGIHITQHSSMCGKCYGKMQSQRQAGRNNHNFNHGRTLAHFCFDCGVKINHMSTRCVKCAGVYRSKTKHLKVKPKLIRDEYAIRRSTCIDCGVQICGENTRCHACYVLWNVGENNPAWMGGITYEPYGREWNDKLKEAVRKRDGHKCQECGVPQSECNTKLDVHHIDYNKKNNSIDNLISLCHACHTALCMRPEWAEPKYKGVVNAVR